MMCKCKHKHCKNASPDLNECNTSQSADLDYRYHLTMVLPTPSPQSALPLISSHERIHRLNPNEREAFLPNLKHDFEEVHYGFLENLRSLNLLQRSIKTTREQNILFSLENAKYAGRSSSCPTVSRNPQKNTGKAARKRSESQSCIIEFGSDEIQLADDGLTDDFTDSWNESDFEDALDLSPVLPIHCSPLKPNSPSIIARRRDSNDLPLVQLFLDGGRTLKAKLELSPLFESKEAEFDSWTAAVGKEVAEKLDEKAIKRQEHIYELILTEKHYCLDLQLMQTIFVEGIKKNFKIGADLDRMFPRLLDLLDIHLEFLSKLRARQNASRVVDRVSDILLEQFSFESAARLKSCYGHFCSHHRDSIGLYKYHCAQNSRFAEFMQICQKDPLLKKKGVPECILLVIQRLTKYPTLIEALIKTTEEKTEQENLRLANVLIKEILVEVDSQIEEKEKEDRKLDIYQKIDPKSCTIYGDTKFKRSGLLAENRKLRFDGVATLIFGGNKMQETLVIVLTDILLFLSDNNNKYAFLSVENKPAVVPLEEVIIREKAGHDSRGIYLISSFAEKPEMYEFNITSPAEKQEWINAIRQAVHSCPKSNDVNTL